MSSLQTALDECVAHWGTSCCWKGACCIHLSEFARHARANHITTELALKWASQPAHAQPSQWANRLGMVRRFAQYCLPNDPRTVVPPPDLLPHRYRRVAPYIYSDQEIIHRLEAARQLPSTIGSRPSTFATLFGLYAACSLRANDALRLDRGDVDLSNGVPAIRETKFGKARYAPVHPSTLPALQRAKLRDRLCATPSSSRFLPFRSRNPGDIRMSEPMTRCDGHLSKSLARSACAAHVTRAVPVCMGYATGWLSKYFSSGTPPRDRSRAASASAKRVFGPHACH
jgi:integrase